MANYKQKAIERAIGLLSDKPSEVSAIPQNSIFGALSRGLESARDIGNKVTIPNFVPLVGGQGVGDYFLGESPEEIKNLSYGNYPFDMPYQGTGGLLPRVKPNRQTSLADTLFLGESLLGVGATSKPLVKSAVKAATPKAQEMLENTMRKTGALLDVAPTGPRGPEMAPRSDLGFYSAVEQAGLNLKRNEGSGQSFLNEINKQPNVKDDEIKWIGLDEFLQNKNKVTKQEIQDYIANNRVDIQEIKLEPKFLRQDRDERTGLPRLTYPDGRVETFMNLTDLQEADAAYFRTGGDAKYANYQLPGGKNYRELLLTMPNDPSYKGKHWSQPNVLAHLRVNDRIDAEGNKVLLLEEVQSDWHQSGRDQGYGPKFEEFFEAYYETEDGQRVVIGAGYTKEEAKASIDPAWKPILNDSIKYKTMKEKVNDGIPDAPMKDTWYQMALKRALKLAADEGYDRLALTTGARQADRYDLSKQVESIKVNYINNQNGGRTIDIRGISPLDQRDQNSYKLMVDKDGKITTGVYAAKQFEGKNISEVIGKEAADKIMKLDQGEALSGVDLKIGGKGMKKYYDEIYPKFLEKYGKKWNAKTGKTKVNRAREGSSISELVTYIDITPEMRGEIKQKGQPLFSAAPFVGSGLLSDDQRDQNNFGLLM